MSGLPVDAVKQTQLVESLCRDKYGLEVHGLDDRWQLSRGICKFTFNPVYKRKTLRGLLNTVVRNCIFVNHNLTKAQFDIRLKCRQKNGIRREVSVMPLLPASTGASSAAALGTQPASDAVFTRADCRLLCKH